YLQSTIADVSINRVQAADTISIATPRSILSSGNTSVQIITPSDLRLLAGTGIIAATSSSLNPLVIDVDGVLTSASAGGNLSLRQVNGSLTFDRIVSGGNAVLGVQGGGLFQRTPGTAIVANSLDLSTSGAVGTPTAFVETKLNPAGDLTAVATGGMYLRS